VLAFLAASVNAQTMTEWDLPKQSLAQSLRDIAAQTDSNIIFDKKLVDGRSAPPLKMKASIEQALQRLLEGTGLTYRILDDKTVTIQLASAKSSTTTSAGPNASDGRIRLAEAQTGEGTRGPTRAVDLEEIVVTGTNIRGIENPTAPLIVLDREYILSTGVGTTTRLIESLPQNFALAGQSSVPVPGITDARTQGSAINLRGLGEGTTLVLLNGRRIALGFAGSAVDVAAIPLSAIERVEILTDGASALYGSDAVGGAVNFILRSDFDGAETRVRGGSADGADEYGASQVLGNVWDSGNTMFSVDYYKRDLLTTDERDFVPANLTVGSLLPEDENVSAMLTARQDLSSTVNLFVEALYTHRDTFNRSGQLLSNETFDSENPQLNATLGLNWRIGGSWQIETSGSYADYDLEQVQTINDPRQMAPNTQNSKFNIESARVKADGVLFGIPGGQVRAAIGADYRSESFETASVNAQGVRSIAPIDIDQEVSSAFAELHIPLIGADNAMTAAHRLEISLAARYDDYSEFGSSFDPKYGIAWDPVSGLKLRASFGTSYVAPRLLDYNPATTRGFGLRQLDPASPTGSSLQVLLLGTDVVSLGPQESDNLSFGVELAPEALPGFQLGLNYFDIEFSDRIANPPTTALILSNPGAFGSLVTRNPTVAQVNEAIRISQLGGNAFTRLGPFDPAAVGVIVDQRRRNLSDTTTSGLDLSTRYDFDVNGNEFSVGLVGSYVLELEQRVTSTSPEADLVDTYINPPRWRARAALSWHRSGLSTDLFVNHTDSYVDNRVPTALKPIRSFTTVDLRVAYDFSSRFKGGVLSGFTIAAGAINLLNEDPPPTTIISPVSDIGFDYANANPLGRLISIELTKTW
jgi:outer membrane receptor protein involved in Fe transport